MTVPDQTDDLALITQVAQHNQGALSLLYDRYAHILYSVAFKMLGSVEETEEIVLDVFAQVWRIASTFDRHRSRVDSWLFMLTRSRTLDRLRQKQRQTKIMDASTVAAQVQGSTPVALPEESLLIQERRDRVQAAMAQIPPEQRQVIEMAYYQGLTQSLIAAQLEISLGTVKTRIRLGLNKLRGLLEAV